MQKLFALITGDEHFDMKKWLLDNCVTLLFLVFIIVGLIVSKGLTINYFLTELSNRFYRNAFLILSLIIPVVAGLGMNFGIVVGAIAGQLAVIAVQYFQLGGITHMSGLFRRLRPTHMVNMYRKKFNFYLFLFLQHVQ